MPVTPQPDSPVELFYSYSHKDEKLREQLEVHLHGLRRQGFISGWHDRRIVAGADWGSEIDLRLEKAGVILLLISPDYIASDYCYGVEMKKALERREAGEAKVIPVILRPCEWEDPPLSGLQALPTDAKAVTNWTNRDRAFQDIARGVKRAVEELRAADGHVTGGTEVLTPTYSDAPETEEHGRWVVVISATVDEIDLDKIKAIEAHLRKLAEDTELTVMRVERGSVVLILEGTRRGFERVNALLEAGRLNDLLGYEVQGVRWGFDKIRPAGRVAPADRESLTSEAFNSMLAWIAPDEEVAAKRYVEIRERLIKIYTLRHAPDPEGLADETINRVAQNIPKFMGGYKGDPAKYFLAVAHHVYLEHARHEVRVMAENLEDLSRAEEPESEEPESEREALLEECMQTLTAQNRELLISYYESSGRERREARKALARKLNISENALHVKVLKLRKQLQKCIENARAQQAKPGDEKK